MNICHINYPNVSECFERFESLRNVSAGAGKVDGARNSKAFPRKCFPSTVVSHGDSWTNTWGQQRRRNKNRQQFSEQQNENCRRRSRKQSVLRSTKVRDNNRGEREPLARLDIFEPGQDRVFACPTKNRATRNDVPRRVNQICRTAAASATADKTGTFFVRICG